MNGPSQGLGDRIPEEGEETGLRRPLLLMFSLLSRLLCELRALYTSSFAG